MSCSRCSKRGPSEAAIPPPPSFQPAVARMSSGFFFVFMSFKTAQFLESTVVSDKQLVEVTLCVLYAFFTAISIVAPTVVYKMGPRLSMTVGAFPYGVAVLAILLPSYGLLVPVFLAVGVGAALLWAGQGIYLSRCAINESAITGESVETITSRFNSQFWTLFQFNGALGLTFASTIFTLVPDFQAAVSYVFIALGALGFLGNAFLFTVPTAPPVSKVVVQHALDVTATEAGEPGEQAAASTQSQSQPSIGRLAVQSRMASFRSLQVTASSSRLNILARSGSRLLRNAVGGGRAGAGAGAAAAAGASSSMLIPAGALDVSALQEELDRLPPHGQSRDILWPGISPVELAAALTEALEQVQAAGQQEGGGLAFGRGDPLAKTAQLSLSSLDTSTSSGSNDAAAGDLQSVSLTASPGAGRAGAAGHSKLRLAPQSRPSISPCYTLTLALRSRQMQMLVPAIFYTGASLGFFMSIFPMSYAHTAAEKKLLSRETVGYISALFFFFNSVASWLWGKCVPRFGKLPLFCICLLLHLGFYPLVFMFCLPGRGGVDSDSALAYCAVISAVILFAVGDSVLE